MKYNQNLHSRTYHVEIEWNFGLKRVSAIKHTTQVDRVSEYSQKPKSPNLLGADNMNICPNCTQRPSYRLCGQDDVFRILKPKVAIIGIIEPSVFSSYLVPLSFRSTRLYMSELNKWWGPPL